ncbi:MAG: metal ABC transporter substrate-binding protein [Candidatus Colwellbacteria bacterium]|nr:metal ABC transporter substrate-binding protein [Candidatus Colwellbacteria bacterium]
MKRAIIVFLVSLSVMFLLVIAASFIFPGRKSFIPSDKPKVAATFFPVYDIVRHIAGDKMDVVRILPSGASPHSFDITPEKVREIQGSLLLFKIGGIDDWTDQAAVSVGAQEVLLSDGITVKNYDVTSVGDEEEDGSGDPHYWMTMRNAKTMAREISRNLSDVDSSNAGYYADNLALFEAEADSADMEIRSALSEVQGGKIVAFHNAWSYFAEEYGLRVVASFEPSPGREPSPAHLKNLSDIVEKEGVKAVFSEPSLSDAPMRAIMGDLGLKLYVLYPEEGLSPGMSFTDTMIMNAKVIAEALSADK